MDAQSALLSASVWGDVEYWVGYTLPRNRQPNNRPQNYDGENGQTMEENGFEKWAPAGDHGQPRGWDRCVHAKANNNGWFMATCSGPRPGVCQLGVRQPPPPSGQLPSLDATITVKRGAEVVLNGSYVTGVITLEEGARYAADPFLTHPPKRLKCNDDASGSGTHRVATGSTIHGSASSATTVWPTPTRQTCAASTVPARGAEMASGTRAKLATRVTPTPPTVRGHPRYQRLLAQYLSQERAFVINRNVRSGLRAHVRPAHTAHTAHNPAFPRD